MHFAEEMRKNAILRAPMCMHIALKQSKAAFPQCQKGILDKSIYAAMWWDNGFVLVMRLT